MISDLDDDTCFIHESSYTPTLRSSVEPSVTWLSHSIFLIQYPQTLGKQEVKQHGEQVLRGEETVPKRRGSTSD